MLFHTKSKNRPYEMGTYPLENLERDDSVVDRESALPRVPAPLQVLPAIAVVHPR